MLVIDFILHVILLLISLKLFNDVEFLLNNLFVNDGSNHYFNLIYKVQTSARDMVKSIVISTFEELDNDFDCLIEEKLVKSLYQLV